MGSTDARQNALLLRYLDQANKCLSCEDYGKAYAFMLLVLKLAPDKKFSIEEEFKEAWIGWSGRLLSMRKVGDLINLYEQGCEAFPECEVLHLTMAEIFYKMDHKLAAHSTYKRVLQLNPNNMVARECMDYLCRTMIDNWHYPMLNDKERNSIFYCAISDHITAAQCFSQETRVLDIGSGTGIMSMFAVQVGCKSVVACESCPTMIRLGRDIIKTNGMEDAITSMNHVSTDLCVKGEPKCGKEEIALPGRVSVVVSEILDAGGFGEGIVKSLDHAWKKLLLPPNQGGTVIPAKIKVKAICIESKSIYEKHCVTSNFANSILITSNVNIDADTCSESILATCKVTEPYTSERLSKVEHKTLSDYHTVQEVNFNDPEQIATIAESAGMPMDIEMTIMENGFLDCLVLCFELALDKSEFPKHILKTDIGAENCWEQAVYPLRQIAAVDGGAVNFSRIPVQEKDVVTFRLIQFHDKIVLQSYYLQNRSDSGKSQEMSRYLGFMNQIPQNSCLFVLNEEEIALLNDSQLWQSYHQSFSTWYMRRNQNTPIKLDDVYGGAMESVPGILSKDGSKTTTQLNGDNTGHCRDEHALFVCDMMTGLPVVTYQLAASYNNVHFHKVCSNEQTMIITKRFTEKIDLKNFSFSADLTSRDQFDAVFVDIVDRNGLLHQDSFSNLIKAKYSVRSSGIIFPSKVMLMGMIIESQELIERCSIPCKSKTMGLNIGDVLKPYRARTLSHIDMHTTKFKALSDPFMCSELDINNIELSAFYESANDTTVRITDTGVAHGVLLWHILQLDENAEYNTSDSRNNCLQSVMMGTHECLSLVPGGFVCVSVRRHLSYVAVDVSKIII